MFLDELVDKPGTTNGTQIDIFQSILLAIFGEMWFLTARPVESFPMILSKLPE